jgi:hypothetical protein
MVSFMLCWTRQLSGTRLAAVALLAASALWVSVCAQAATYDVSLQRDGDGLYINASSSWRPSSSVVDALQRGIPMTFIMQAQVLKPRWYWWDKSVHTTTRSSRLAYQPLTRQWRISVSTASSDEVAGLTALHQNVDTLDTALALISRAKYWRIASASMLGDAQGTKEAPSIQVRFTFKLDLSALPRPFQIGVTDNPDWSLNTDTLHDVPALPSAAVEEAAQ